MCDSSASIMCDDGELVETELRPTSGQLDAGDSYGATDINSTMSFAISRFEYSSCVSDPFGFEDCPYPTSSALRRQLQEQLPTTQVCSDHRVPLAEFWRDMPPDADTSLAGVGNKEYGLLICLRVTMQEQDPRPGAGSPVEDVDRFACPRDRVHSCRARYESCERGHVSVVVYSSMSRSHLIALLVLTFRAVRQLCVIREASRMCIRRVRPVHSALHPYPGRTLICPRPWPFRRWPRLVPLLCRPELSHSSNSEASERLGVPERLMEP